MAGQSGLACDEMLASSHRCACARPCLEWKPKYPCRPGVSRKAVRVACGGQALSSRAPACCCMTPWQRFNIFEVWGRKKPRVPQQAERERAITFRAPSHAPGSCNARVQRSP
eukprot:352152-Chlamydomonas_euryale.AAC.7